MDKSEVSKIGPDVATKFISLDRTTFDSAINEYFDDNCTQSSRLLTLRGVSRIKKLARLEAFPAAASYLIEEPHCDVDDETISFAYERIYIPAVPSFLPFSAFLNGHLSNIEFSSIWDSQLHLNAAENDDGETKLYVTKVGPTERRGTYWFENILPFFIISPLLSFFLTLAFDITSILSRHPIAEEGPFGAAYSTIAEFIGQEGSVDTEIGYKNHVIWPFRAIGVIIRLIGNSITSSLSFIHSTLHLDNTNPIIQLVSSILGYSFAFLSVLYQNVRHFLYTLFGVAEGEAEKWGMAAGEYKALGERYVGQTYGVIDEGLSNAKKVVRKHAQEPSRNLPAPKSPFKDRSWPPQHSSQEPGAPSYVTVAKEGIDISPSPQHGHNSREPGAPSYAAATKE
ncbi:hypothetical protein B9479_001757 [Cryptococcus floricola]|uniref:Uncharacterized protein n=1 Tax=Cryptococcus floricola TaxID=2591691 RepID=A0A5D3B4G6_9TREE|nr:hypothetical protein B9479_001757 [Cryptococcus floricola]